MLVLKDDQNNLFVYIHTNDQDPAHVHVHKGSKQDNIQHGAKIELGNENEPPSLKLADEDMKNKDIINSINLVRRNQEMLLKKWEEIHGISKMGGSSGR